MNDAKICLLKNFNKRLLNDNLLLDSLWSLLGTSFSRFFGLILGVFLAKFLGVDVFGQYGFLKSTAISLGIFTSFGIGYTSTKYIANHVNNTDFNLFRLYKKLITLTFFSGLTISFFIFIFSNEVAKYIFELPEISHEIKIIAFFVFFNSLVTTQVGTLAGLKEFKRTAKTNSIISFISFLLTIFLTYYFLLFGALIALTITQIIFYFSYNKLINSNFFILKSNEKSFNITYREVIKFSFPIALQEITYSFFTWINFVVLLRLSNYVEIGLYSAGNHWKAMILFIPGIFKSILLSYLSSNEQNIYEFKNLFKKVLLLNLIVSIFPALIIIISSPFIESYYGSSYEGLSTVLSFLVLGTIAISVSNVYVQAYLSKGQNWLMFYFKCINHVGTLLTFYLFATSSIFSPVMSLVMSILIWSLISVLIMAYTYHLKILR